MQLQQELLPTKKGIAMLEIQVSQIEKATALMTALGLKFHIVGNGYEWGAPIQKSKSGAPRRSYSPLKVAEKVRSMKIFDVIVFTKDEVEAAGFKVSEVASNASSIGVSEFGQGAFTTSYKTGNVECMRTA